MSNSCCKIPKCPDTVFAAELCSRHYTQMRRHGKILARTIHDKNEIEIKEKYALIYLYDEDFEVVAKAKIDLADVKRVKKYKWTLCNGYVVYKKKNIYLHRFILSAKSGVDVDHINRNKLNNRRKNLRFCKKTENSRNIDLTNSNTSGAKGVYWNKVKNKYHARIKMNKKIMHLGYFDDLIEAARAYNKAAKKYFGEFACLNDIKKIKR